MSDLLELLEQLRLARIAVATSRETYLDARQIWEREHMLEIEQLAADQKRLGELTEQVRAVAVAAYEASGNKKPAPGIQIRVKRNPNYLTHDALDWALEHQLALQLDPAAFERHMLAIPEEQRPDWFALHKYAEATIAKNLDSALQGAGKDAES